MEFISDLTRFSSNDLFYFRCAAEAIQSNNSIYGLALMRECLSQYADSSTAPSFIFSPFGLWLIYLFGIGSFEFTRNALMIFSLLTWLYSYIIIIPHRRFENIATASILFIGILISFPPILKNLIFGQISILLLGVWLFATLIRNHRPFSAGLLYGILMLKPQIFIPVALGLLPYFSFRNATKFIAGIAFSVSIQLTISLYLYPNLFSDLFNSANNFSRLQHFPNINFFFSYFSHSILLNYFIFFIGNLIALVCLKYKKTLQHAPDEWLAICAVLFAPYIWLHDLIFLAPSFIYLSYHVFCRTRVGYALLSIIAFLLFSKIISGEYANEGIYCLLPIGLVLLMFINPWPHKIAFETATS